MRADNVKLTSLAGATFTIRVKLTKQFHFRIWLGLKLMSLGVRITGAAVKVVKEK